MHTRKFLPILVVIALVAGLFGIAQPTLAAPGDIVLSYTLPSAQINPGDNIAIPVNINVIAGKTLAGGQFNLSWNPAVLDLVSITNGSFFPNNCPAGATPFFNNATINHAAGTMSNYGFAALGLAAGTGCTGNGVLATLNFHAVALGQSANAVSGIIMSAQNGTQFPAADTTFPNFTLFVGSAPRLVVTGVAFTPTGGTPPGSNFNAVITVANQGGNASSADTLAVTTDSHAIPASTNVPVPALAAGASQQFTVAMQMVAGQSSARVTASIATFSTTASNTYSPVSSSANTNVDATVGAYIRLTADAAINFGTLVIGSNAQPGSINVQCNTNYEVDATTNPSDWRMAEWNGTVFVANGRKLQDNLVVQAAGFSPLTAPGGMLLTGTVAGQGALNAGQTFPLTYTVHLFSSDPLLPAGETYHLVMTYNGFVTQ